MAYQAQKLEMSYEYAQLLPKKDSANIDYQNFKKIFGEEGNLIVVGIENPDFFKLSYFNQWCELNDDLKRIDGVEDILSASGAFTLKKNTEERKFELDPIFPENIDSQEKLDSLAKTFHSLPFYRGLLYNPEAHVYMLAVTVNKDKMASKAREKLVLAIKDRCDRYSEESALKVHYSGLPYIRVINSIHIKKEIFLFSALAMALCIITLFLFFRSFKAVLIPMLIVSTGVVWAMGTMSLLGFKITLLTGMIPSLLIVIGIPNSIYMLNKYHHEFRAHGNKIKSLQRVIIKIGNATFLTNLTTASGFATFVITNSEILRQFGLVAALNIMTLFLLSLAMIPTIFSFFNPPQARHIQHLENKNIRSIIDKLVDITYHHIKWVYISAFFILLLGIYGISLIKSSGYMVDDIPESDVIYKDLKFFEKHIDGIMPLEIIVDTKKPNGAMNLSTFNLIDKLEKHLTNYEELSSSLSLLNILKFSKQAFYNGKERYYTLPSNQEKNFILAYANNATQNSQNSIGALHSFLDSTQQITRVSIRMKDVGTKRMEELYHEFKQEVDSIFPADKYKVTVTGSSITFFKGTKYLVKNLFSSLALAIFLISSFMALMFYSWRMVVMSLIPNILPLIFTAAIMGFTGIPIKASTILVFSIAFGISVDNTIHFLAKYRQELNVTGWDIHRSVKRALRETGVSMLYTFVVLFFGFGVYSISKFGGTAALGVLVSLTLLVAITSNLILLPSLLIGLERLTTTRSFREPLLSIYNEEEDIELDDLEIQELPMTKEQE
ncbi:efflux RND transporter permease subunit [Gaoshiqia sp. Z1-71]|uniref:efflux RND transporter permease subunit n=1 Tax=Gaoshiqia hydrogeniformans TaxID=3290090 RepID=UPI003BF7C7FC